MNNTIIKNWNKVVSEEDTVYVLGDVAMLPKTRFDRISAIVHGLKGHKHLILGNHDNLKAVTYIRMGFESVHTSLSTVFYYGSRRNLVNMIHNPAMFKLEQSQAEQCKIYNEIWLSGHIHEKWSHKRIAAVKAFVYNVGVDVRDFTPVSLPDLVWDNYKVLRK
jgi:calcineurin-like phosphoesterase family protein